MRLKALMILVAALVIVPVARPAETLNPSSIPIPPQYFGLHIHRLNAGTPWPAVKLGSWRLWDAHVAWPFLEPAPNKWDFSMLDKYVDQADRERVDVLLPLALSPAWASSRPNERSAYKNGNAAPPKDISEWRKYVLKVATRYKGRIHHYEIWNEPNVPKFFSGSAQELVNLTKVASQALKEVDPGAKLVSPSATDLDGYKYLDTFLKQGGNQWVDVIGYHFYVAANPPERQVELIKEVKKVMQQDGAGEKPLWDTESGWAHPKPFPSQELAAGYLARAYILNWAAGVSRFYWYSWDNHDWVSIETLTKDDKQMTPAGHAYGTISDWLIGAKMTSCNSADSTWTCTLDRNGSTEYIYWNPDRTTTISVPKIWQRTDCEQLLGGNCPIRQARVEVGPLPILLRQKK